MNVVIVISTMLFWANESAGLTMECVNRSRAALHKPVEPESLHRGGMVDKEQQGKVFLL
jgi:hypothetical protein